MKHFKIFKEAQIRELEQRHAKGEISKSRFVERLNEIATQWIERKVFRPEDLSIYAEINGKDFDSFVRIHGTVYPLYRSE